MSETYYRVQSGDRDTNDLLDPAYQISQAWGHEHLDDRRTDRAGVSVCDSREALAAYLAGPGQGIPFGSGGWVLVELRGVRSDDQPLDAEHGEYLIHPTEIVTVAQIDDEFLELIGAAYDAAESAR